MFVREAKKADAVGWKRRRNELWSADTDDEIDAFFAGVGTPITIAFMLDRGNGELAGLIELSTRSYAEGCDSSPVPYIEAWYVDEDVRGTGKGRELVAAAEDWARNQGFTELASDCELDNSGSEAAHKSLGFEETDRIICFRKAL